MPDDDKNLSLVGSEIPCAEVGCGLAALTTCKYCWFHLPDGEKSGFRDKIERLAAGRKGDLKKFILRGAALRGASLSRANLQLADLAGTELQGTILFGANLRGAIVLGAWLQGALLIDADLMGADLSLVFRNTNNLT